MKVPSVKGMRDVLPTLEGDDAAFNSRVWEKVEGVAREVFRRYSFDRVRTPVVEEAQLYARSVGEATDIVGKEMYTFPDRSGKRLYALQPEGTAGVVRAYIEDGLPMRDPVQRWWYFGPMFRHERQQRHRYRQFHQIGLESFGVEAPEADVEVLAIGHAILAGLDLEGIELRLNSIGDEVCRPAYLEELRAFLRQREGELCTECRERLERNALRVLDCKSPGCSEVTADAPASVDHLCQPCEEHFDRVLSGARALGLRFELDKRLVRGLDYYTRTSFEFVASALGSGQQTAVCGGGRYDALVKLLGGADTPAVGFGMGVERLCALVAESEGIPLPRPALFLAIGGDDAREQAMALAEQGRAAGLSVEVDLRGGRLSRQLARADKRGARFAVVIGGAEVQSGRARLKEMASGDEVEVDLEQLPQTVRSRLEEAR